MWKTNATTDVLKLADNTSTEEHDIAQTWELMVMITCLDLFEKSAPCLLCYVDPVGNSSNCRRHLYMLHARVKKKFYRPGILSMSILDGAAQNNFDN